MRIKRHDSILKWLSLSFKATWIEIGAEQLDSIGRSSKQVIELLRKIDELKALQQQRSDAAIEVQASMGRGGRYIR